MEREGEHRFLARPSNYVDALHVSAARDVEGREHSGATQEMTGKYPETHRVHLSRETGQGARVW